MHCKYQDRLPLMHSYLPYVHGQAQSTFERLLRMPVYNNAVSIAGHSFTIMGSLRMYAATLQHLYAPWWVGMRGAAGALGE